MLVSTKSRQRTTANQFAVRLAIFYGASFLIVGAYIPYFPVWLDGRGLDKAQIAIILATPLLARIVFTPAITFLSDRFNNVRGVLIMLSWGTLASLIALSQMHGFWPLFLLSLIFSLAWTTIMPLTETMAMTGVQQAGLDYGRMRLWGSATFIAMSFLGGYAIDGFGSPAAMVLLLGAAIMLSTAALWLPHPPLQTHPHLPAAKPSPPSPPSPHSAVHWKDVAALSTSPLFLLFLMTASLVQATHAVYYGFGTLHWQSIGISTGTIGALWATGVLAEIILFAFSGAAVVRFGITGLLVIGAVAAIVRWASTALDPALWVLFPLQTLHALTFGATHLGAIHFVSKAVPQQYAATAQGIYASFSMGIVMGIMTMLSGPLYTSLNGYAYMVMAITGALASFGAWLLWKFWDGQPVITPTS